MQLTAYSMLVEEKFNKDVKRGILYYVGNNCIDLVRITYGMRGC